MTISKERCDGVVLNLFDRRSITLSMERNKDYSAEKARKGKLYSSKDMKTDLSSFYLRKAA